MPKPELSTPEAYLQLPEDSSEYPIEVTSDDEDDRRFTSEPQSDEDEPDDEYESVLESGEDEEL